MVTLLGGFMKKAILCIFLFFTSFLALFAGDAAAFVDLGFSNNGQYYAFAEYGKEDKIFIPWAKIYIVDIKNNNFIKGGVLQTRSKDFTTKDSGKKAYEHLLGKNYSLLKKYDCKPVTADEVLYLRKDYTKKGSDKIVFKDFQGSPLNKPVIYNLQVVSKLEGKGINTKSSFYIDFKTTDDKGNIIKQKKIGTPSLKRTGVVDYRIIKVIRSYNKKNLVFVIEKKIQDKSGILIRYMVEAATI